jgi:hypothetical protein
VSLGLLLEAEHMAMLELACCSEISQVILMNIKPILVIVLIASYLAVLVSPMHAQTAGEVLKVYETLKKPERKAGLIEGAKKEGRLVFYGTLGVDASRPMLEKFRQGYPYISIDHYRSGSVGIYNRVVNEARAGKHEVDIIELSAGPVSDLIRGGFIDPYRSSEADTLHPEFMILDIFGTPTTIWLWDLPTTRIWSRPSRSRRRTKICCCRAGREIRCRSIETPEMCSVGYSTAGEKSKGLNTSGGWLNKTF